MIGRREFITLLGGTAAAWPVVARAQQPGMPVVGFLHNGSPEPKLVAAFRKGLSETGYVEGRNVTIEFRWAEGQRERVPAMAADLVRRRVAVIVTPGNPTSALAAKAATATIPIIFSGPGDPVQTGLVTSLSRPSGNVTGFSEMAAELLPKRLGIMHELMPNAIRFVLLVEPTSSNATNPAVITDLQAAASAIGQQVEVLQTSFRDLDAAFESLVQKRVDAILVSPSADSTSSACNSLC
jgi:putative tryptophan/tyrosine transport system substrate-binding protein